MEPTAYQPNEQGKYNLDAWNNHMKQPRNFQVNYLL